MAFFLWTPCRSVIYDNNILFIFRGWWLAGAWRDVNKREVTSQQTAAQWYLLNPYFFGCMILLVHGIRVVMRHAHLWRNCTWGHKTYQYYWSWNMLLYVMRHDTVCHESWYCMSWVMILYVMRHDTVCHESRYCMSWGMILYVMRHDTVCHEAWYCMSWYMILYVMRHDTVCRGILSP